jgi:hypothetical protein
MRNFTIFLALSILLSSCASILNPRYQKITINTDPQSKILIDGEESEGDATNRHKFKRDRRAKQITVQRAGYKDVNVAIAQYKKSPLFILSFVPFGIFYAPFLFDSGPKSSNYQKQVTIDDKMTQLPEKDEKAKEIMLKKVSVDIDPENLKYRYFYSYRNYLNKEDKKKSKASETEEKVALENTIFTDALNELLVEQGYIDTTAKILKNSFLNNLLIESTITGTTFHSIGGQIFFVDLTIDWRLLDLYENVLHEETTESGSGQFVLNNYKSSSAGRFEAIKDAMEYGFLDFMKKDEVVKLMNDRSDVEAEASYTTLVIQNGKAAVESIADAVESSVTVKNKDGHGSGFIISENGYIVTNYHVIANAEDLSIVFNNGIELQDVEVVRFSKIYDLALLKVEVNNLVPFNISDDKKINIGADIFAVGTPTAEDLNQTVSKGIISGKRKMDDVVDLIQIDASINAGNSGGAIVNKEGLVLGVVSSKVSGSGIEGVAFGIPAYQIMERLKVAFQ